MPTTLVEIKLGNGAFNSLCENSILLCTNPCPLFASLDYADLFHFTGYMSLWLQVYFRKFRHGKLPLDQEVHCVFSTHKAYECGVYFNLAEMACGYVIC